MPAPREAVPQGLREAFRAARDRRLSFGLWLTMLAGVAFGVLDVLAPLRLATLGVTALVIAGTFLASAALEAVLSPVAGRAADRRGAIVPIGCSLVGAVAVSLLAPTLASARVLIPALILGMPSFGTLFTPAMALVSEGAQRLRLDQGLAFGLSNLAWASRPGHGRRGQRGPGPGHLGPRPLLTPRGRVRGDPRLHPDQVPQSVICHNYSWGCAGSIVTWLFG